jgi:hypothetical protein
MAVNGHNKGVNKYDYSDQPADDFYYGPGFVDALDRLKGIDVRGLGISDTSITEDMSSIGNSGCIDSRIDGSIVQRPLRQITARVKISPYQMYGFNESYRRKAIEDAELKVRDELFRSFNQFIHIDKIADYDGSVTIVATIDV